MKGIISEKSIIGAPFSVSMHNNTHIVVLLFHSATRTWRIKKSIF